MQDKLANKEGARSLSPDMEELAQQIRAWSRELGFQQTGFSDTKLDKHEAYLNKWLAKGYHGEMDYMQRHGTRRSRPQELHPGTIRVISVRLDYLPESAGDVEALLKDPSKGVVSRYALGRDYHKMMRKRLQKLAQQIEQQIGPLWLPGVRGFCTCT